MDLLTRNIDLKQLLDMRFSNVFPNKGILRALPTPPTLPKQPVFLNYQNRIGPFS
jgi:hypothetical protein